jgi:tRNA (guanine26-N2/guanine27-N2)-dimethyltransferase
LANQSRTPVEPFFPFATETLREASAVLLVPRLETYFKGRQEYIPSRTPVFYNPLMSFNRDVAVLALRAYQRRVQRSLDVCEPFTGCGVRVIRFAKEVPHVRHLVLNDLNPQAINLTRFNVERNGLSEKITIQQLDAHALLSRHARPKKRFDVVDLDPFGSPSPFLDSAVRAIKRGGLLALTATDMAPLCGVKPAACVRKYLGKPLRTAYCHEVAVRLVLNALVLNAAKHDLGVTVFLSHSTDHYIRVYTQIVPGAQRANDAIGRLGYLVHCFHCLNRRWTIGLSNFPPRTCAVCGGEMAVAGPLWMGNLFDSDFCRDMLEDARSVELGDRRRVVRLLNAILTEVGGPPTYYVVDKISEKLGLPGLSKAALIEKLVDSGYHATETHFNPRGIRSNAPISVIDAHSRELSRG